MLRILRGRRRHRRRAIGLSAASVSAFLILGASACGATATPSDALSGQETNVLAVGELVRLPGGMVTLYRYAEANPALLERIPCYCGCGETAGHRHLRDCFVNDDGIYERHASGCGICIAEANEIRDLRASGKPLVGIRATIDARFASMGTPTDTPPVTGD